MENKYIDFHKTPFYNGPNTTFGKIPVNLSLNLKFPEEDGFMMLEFTLGLDKMYRITELKNFLNSYEKAEPYYFSKNFIFEPDRMYFTPEDKCILEFMQNLKARGTGNKEKEDGQFSGGKVFLDAAERELFLDLIWKGIDNIRFAKEGDKFRFENDAKLLLSVRKEDTGNLLCVDYSEYGDFLPVTLNFKYVVFKKQGILAKLPENKRELFIYLYPYKNEENNIIFKISTEDKKFFQKNFIEKYRGELNISLDTATEGELNENSLVSKVYFDVATVGIVSKIEFCYGNKAINPLGDESSDKSFREYNEERAVIFEMKALGFREYGKL